MITFPQFLIAEVVVLLLVGIYFISKKKGVSLPNMPRAGSRSVGMYSTDFTLLAATGKIDPVVGREKEILRLTQILSRRTKNNAILLGAPGVGKTAIVEGLAKRIIEETIPSQLIGKRVIALDIPSLMGGTKYRGEFEKRIKELIHEIERSERSIILFIDEIHTIVQSHGSEGAINFADILKPALARGDLQLIGATTYEEYEQYLKKDASLERRFQLVEVEEPSAEETVSILKGVADKFRDYHKVEFTDTALEFAALLSDKLIKDRRLPDKAIDVMDEAASMIKVSHVHEHIPAVLYAAAAAKHPQVIELWKEVQRLDSQLKEEAIGNREQVIAKREALEKQLQEIGVLTVDSSDVQTIVEQWEPAYTQNT